jgi:glycopeptide antibiotics resistance protein
MGIRPQVAGWLLIVYTGIIVVLSQWHLWPASAHPQIVNLVLFRGLSQSLSAGGLTIVINVVGNIVAFMPIGLLLPLWHAAGRHLRTVALIGCGISSAIEALQWIQGQRVTDVDDVMLNTLGSVLGYLGFLVLTSWIFRSINNTRREHLS